MCGIAGFIDFKRESDETRLAALVHTMNESILHRGPDAEGTWIDQANGVALGHRRLAIIDLSETGSQPMISASGRYVLSYNGEVYNFRSLKKRLVEKHYPFRGTSDTEVLLAGFELWGVENTLNEINGMFAFALWDRKERVLYLATDRMGKKPLYYGWAGKTFLFGSELKALRAHPAFDTDVDPDALCLYARHNYVPAPWSIYKGIFKLPPASFLTLPLDNTCQQAARTYWNIKDVAEKGSHDPLAMPFDKILDSLDELLSDATGLRMISDVPLGAFLSGGIDSSLITALMQKQSSQPVKTFSIAFEEADFDEAKFARKIADHLGTDHTEFVVTADEARKVIPDLPTIYDEPFADPSQIPTYHVSRLARQHVTVALSGDGGDEAFAGYGRYFRAENWARKILILPLAARVMLSRMIPLLPSTRRLDLLYYYLPALDENHLYRLMNSYWKDPSKLTLHGNEPRFAISDESRTPNIDNFTSRMLYWDMISYLPNDILVKVDRASMAVSLETRAPLLDYRVIEFAWTLPQDLKTQGNTGKLILRSLLERYIPKSLFERPKQGFGIPHGQWLRGPLREWAGDLLDESRLKKEGFFQPEPIRKIWREHMSGQHDWGYQLWGLLMFQAWYEAQAR